MQTITTRSDTPAIRRAANVYALVTRARAERKRARSALALALVVAIVATSSYTALVLLGQNLPASILGGAAVLAAAVLLTIRQFHINRAANYDDRATFESEALA